MTDLDTLTSLRERVLAAEGPDDLLNDNLCIALQFAGKGHPNAVNVRHAEYDGEGWIDFEQEGEDWSNHTPEVTASIDEALGLVERVLPPIEAFAPGSPASSGWKIGLYRGMTPTGERFASWECMIRKHAGKEDYHCAPTAPLAILAALLSALIANADAHKKLVEDR